MAMVTKGNWPLFALALLVLAGLVSWFLFRDPFGEATESVEAGGAAALIEELVVSSCALDPGDRAILDADVSQRLDAYGHRRRIECKGDVAAAEGEDADVESVVEKKVEAAKLEAEVRRGLKAEVEAQVAAEKAAEKTAEDAAAASD